MPKSKELFKQVVNDIALNEPQGEIESIVYILFEKLLGLSRPDILLNRDVALTNSPELKAAINRINQHEPIQYIVEEAEFYGRKFFVNSNVLIPRPETELLISEIVNRNIARPKILDIGTGSGCIAVSLSLEIPTSQIHGLDISEPALQIARKNNNGLGGTSNFFRADIINDQIPLQQLDFIVSNPPYIADSEKKNT